MNKTTTARLITKFEKQRDDGYEAQSRLYPPCPNVKRQILDAETILTALQAQRERAVDVEEIKRQAHNAISYAIPHSYSHNTLLNTLQWLFENNHLRTQNTENSLQVIEGLDRDSKRLAIWQAIQNIEIGNKTDDKLILAELEKLGFTVVKALCDRKGE